MPWNVWLDRPSVGRAVPRPPQASRGGRATVLSGREPSGKSPLGGTPDFIGMYFEYEYEDDDEDEFQESHPFG